MGHPWTSRFHSSNRTIVRGQSKTVVEGRVEANIARGYTALMDVKEDFDEDGRMFYVCVMERKSPSK